MLWNLCSPRTANLSLEDVLELVDQCLENARKEDDTANTLEFITSAKSLLKDAENIFASNKVKDPALSKGIANAYHEHGKLLDELGRHDKAAKSHSKAEKLGYGQVVSRHTTSSQSIGKSGTIRQPLLSTPDLSVPPRVAAAICQDSSNTDVTQFNHQDHIHHATPAEGNNGKPTLSKDAVQISQKIFDQKVTPPVIKYALPEPNGRIISTPQLAYCLSLLRFSMVSEEKLDQSGRDWLHAKADDRDEQERLESMATALVRAFVREELKKPHVVAEVVSLAAVLKQDDFRKLLQAFVDGIDQSLLLDVHLLNGLAQLIRNAPQGYIDADDLVKILELLNTRLNNTHSQSTQYTYQLALTISQVLDSMVDSQVKGLSREQLHEPLSDYLKGLQQNPDPYLIYQAAYAYQALQYVPDDETILQSMMRRTGKVVQGVSGVVSAVKALDLVGFIEGLQNVQQGLAGAEKVIGLVSDACSNMAALVESGQGLSAAFKEALNFKHKGSWYPALRGLDRLVQEGRFSDFEELVREAPCKRDPLFRWGVCQRLGEIAANTIWDINIRKCAVCFLRQLYKEDANKDQLVSIRQWILHILSQLAESSKDIMEGSVQKLLQENQVNSSPGEGILYHGCGNDSPVLYRIMATPPSMEYPLLYCVQNIPDVETPLRQLKQKRLEGRDGDVYISPRAKTTSKATDDFDLTTKVQEFLISAKKVFLLRGDSGAGKSTFNKALEISLWDDYDRINRRIPLFIHLPEIEKPERDLIAEKLRKVNFTESQILELKLHREFILICDGYDESQQTQNLYMSNQLNQPGQWRAQMVISCRTEYSGVDYKDYFRPTDRNRGGDIGQFQEVIISPFTEEQIQDYIGQYVSTQKPPWESEDYLRAIEQIPNLKHLVNNPFLLRLALVVLPQLSKKNTELSSTHVTRLQLYDEFVAQWIDRGKIRLMGMELNPYDKDTFKQMTDSGLQQHGTTYLKKLVTAIYEHQNGNPVVNYSVHADQGTWKDAFFSKRDGNHLLREVIPLTRNGDQYRFIHKSLLEYGLSLAVFGPSKRSEDTEARPPMSKRGSTSSVLSFESPSSTERTDIAHDKLLLDSPLGKINLVGEQSILRFLTERVQQEAVFKDQLHSVIERSKTDKTARIGAANAITILVRAGVQFNNADLRNIKIPGADLSFGVFDSAQLEGADLRKANLRNVWMRQANLRGAQMKGVQFGELPFLEEDSHVTCGAYSPDGKTYAAGLSNGNISFYETLSWNRIRRLEGHSDIVNSLSFSAIGGRIASGSGDKTVRLWDVDTGECVHALQGHSDAVFSVVCSPKGYQIASGGDDSTVRLWDVDTGECIRTLQDHSDAVLSVMYSPSGDRIASRSRDGTVRVWDVDTGECVHTLQGHGQTVWSVVYSPKGDQIASGSYDETVRIWDLETGESIHILQGHSCYVRCVVYSPKGDRIASGSGDKTVRLWDVDTGECVRTFWGHIKGVIHVVYSPKGDRIVSGSDDCTVRLWDVDTGECVHALQGHSSYISSVMYSPKGGRIASGSWDGTVRVWGVDTGECVHALQGHSNAVLSIVCSPKGDQIASGSDDCTVRLWDVDTGKCVHTLQGHSDYIHSIMYSPKGDHIASVSGDSTVRLWGVDTGKCIHTSRGHGSNFNSAVYSSKRDQIAFGSYDETVRLWDVNTGEYLHTLRGHNGYVRSVAYSPKGDQIASGNGDGTVRLWSVNASKCVHTLQGHSGYVISVVYSPKGDRIASGGQDKTVRLWDVDTRECVYVLLGHDDVVRTVAYSPKGDHVASGSNDSMVRLWDVDTGECVHTLLGHGDAVLSVVYSPKGDRIASGSRDNTVRVWNVDSGECIHTLQGHSGYVLSVVYLPKGDRIASGSQDRTVRLWDVDTGECVHTLLDHVDVVRTVVYSPKGDWFASGSSDRTVRLWDVDTGECVHTLWGHSDTVNCVTCSPKGDQIASGSDDSRVRLWNVDTGECIHTLEGHSHYVDNVMYSPKGDQIASGSYDSTLRLWDVHTGECLHILRGRSDWVGSVVYSPEGDLAASESYDSTVQYLGVDTGECVHTLHRHSGYIKSVVYSPKGDQIASGNGDGTVQLWNIDTGDCIHTLQGHSGWISCVVYSSKGNRIASGSWDETVRVWDVDTAECIHTLQGHSDYVRSVVYSPKGDRIASGSGDMTVRLWDVDTGECIHTFQDYGWNVSGVVYSPRGDRIAYGSRDNTVKLWSVETGQCLVTILGFSNVVSSIVMEDDFDALHLVTGSRDKSVRRWRITEERDGHKAVLCWSSSHEVLTVCDLSFNGAHGLSRLNQELLIQRGASIPTPLPSDRGNVETSTLTRN